MRSFLPSSFLLLLASGCASAPVEAIPDPLPEVLAWAARPAQAESDTRAFLGLEVRENDSGSLEALSFDPGVRVTRVADGSPAKAAGFRVGDVLIRFGDVTVSDPSALDALLRQTEPDTEVELEALRGDGVFAVTVTLRALEGDGDASDGELLWRLEPARSRAGWRAGRGGVVLVCSAPAGPFPEAGVEVGSVVTAIDGVEVRSETALMRALLAESPGATVAVEYRTAEGDAESADVRLFRPDRRITDASLPILAGYQQSADGETANAYLIDLWAISLFRYRREGGERHYRFLRFIAFSTGVGHLEEEER